MTIEKHTILMREFTFTEEKIAASGNARLF